MQINILKMIPGVGKFHNHKPTLKAYQELIMENYILSTNEFLHRHEGTVKLYIYCYHATKLGAKPTIKVLTDTVVQALTNVAFESPEQISYIGVSKIKVNDKRLQRLQVEVVFEPYATHS